MLTATSVILYYFKMFYFPIGFDYMCLYVTYFDQFLRTYEKSYHMPCLESVN